MTKLSDRKLAQLLDTINMKYSSDKNAGDLDNFIYYAMQPGGMYSNLSMEEKEEVLQVLDIYKEAVADSKLLETRKTTFAPAPANYNWSSYPSWSDVYYHDHCHTNTFIFINTGSGDAHAHGHSTGCGSCFGGGGSGSSEAQLVMILVGILIAIIAAIALLASFYLVRQVLNDLDRAWHNEGRLQAVVSLAFMAGSAAAMGMLMNTLLTGAFASFLLAVGFSNPIALAIFTVFCVAGIATVPVNWLGQVAQGKVTELIHPNALEPTDPSRFALTDSEARQLEDKGIDPLRVKCSIVALHASIKGQDTSLYSRNSLFDNRSSEVQSTLKQIRGLRDGSITELNGKGLTLDCKKRKYHMPFAVAVPLEAIEPSAPPISAFSKSAY